MSDTRPPPFDMATFALATDHQMLVADRRAALAAPGTPSPRSMLARLVECSLRARRVETSLRGGVLANAEAVWLLCEGLASLETSARGAGFEALVGMCRALRGAIAELGTPRVRT